MKKAIVDKQGRIVIPISFRDQLGVREGTAVAITLENNSVVIRREQSACKRCGSFVKDGTDFPLCKACFEHIKRSYT